MRSAMLDWERVPSLRLRVATHTAPTAAATAARLSAAWSTAFA